MGKRYDDYMDEKRIQEEMRRERAKREGRVSCRTRGGQTDVRLGTTYAGPIVCRDCRGLDRVTGYAMRIPLTVQHEIMLALRCGWLTYVYLPTMARDVVVMDVRRDRDGYQVLTDYGWREGLCWTEQVVGLVERSLQQRSLFT